MYNQIHSPTMVQGEWGGGGWTLTDPSPLGFVVLQYLKTFLLLVVSDMFYKLDEVNIMGCGAAVGL